MRAFITAGVLAAALAFGGASSPAFAITNSDTSPFPPAKEVTCKKPLVQNSEKTDCVPCPKGWAYNDATQLCKKAPATNSSELNDRDLYEQGRALALAGHYQDALDLFGLIRNKHDAMVLTMIGYSKRKLGFTDEGIAIYHEALAIDPNNLNTHEYLGEGYLAAGRVDLAELELDKLGSLCGEGCLQYKALQGALIGDAVWH